MGAADKLWASLLVRYGREKAELVYNQMRATAQGPFAAGNKLHDEHVRWAEGAGVPPIEDKKKPPASLPGAAPWRVG